jgi:hypothetical protein
MSTGAPIWALSVSAALISLATAMAPQPKPIDRADPFAAAILAYHYSAVRYAVAHPATTSVVSAASLAVNLPAGYRALPNLTLTACIQPGTPRTIVTWTPAAIPGGLAPGHVAASFARQADRTPSAGVTDNASHIVPVGVSPPSLVTVPSSAPCGPLPTGVPAIVTPLG